MFKNYDGSNVNHCSELIVPVETILEEKDKALKMRKFEIWHAMFHFKTLPVDTQ